MIWNCTFKEIKKWASYLHRTAQPLTLASFQTWGSSAGAGRIRLARRKSMKQFLSTKVIGTFFY